VSLGGIMSCRRATRLAGLLATSILLVASCRFGQASATPAPTPTPTPTLSLSAQPTPSPTPTVTPSPLDVSLVVAFGTVYGRTGEPHCPNWVDHWDDVVLTQSKLTYSADELSRMLPTITKTGPNYGALDPAFYAIQPGVATAPVPGSRPGDVASLRLSSACVFSIEVTNTGSTALQIPRAGLRLTGNPQPNQASYRLVEFCSVAHDTQFCGPQVGGVPRPCSVYGVEIGLENHTSGDDVMSAPEQIDQNGQPCPQLTLSPNQSVTIVIGAYSTDPMIYQAEPVLQVITPTAQGMVTFVQLGAVYAFADPSQFTCYRLSGSTFVVWQQGASAYDFHRNQSLGGWCV